MKLYKQYVLQALITLAMMFLFACEKDPEQHLELGNWYLQKGLIDDAITEYREVSRLLPPDHSKLDREQFKILGTAHFKLALSYTKKGCLILTFMRGHNNQIKKNHFDIFLFQR